MKDEIQGALYIQLTYGGLKRGSLSYVSCEKAKAYCALAPSTMTQCPTTSRERVGQVVGHTR